MSTAVPIRSTVVDVDLDAIARNLAALRARANGAQVIAVVKADAYGHGAEAVGPVLVEAGASMLAVVTLEEALVLREAGVRAPILVFLGAQERADADIAVAADLTLVVWDAEDAKRIAEAAAAAHRTASVHFKVDTGMTRLGAPFQAAAERYRSIRDIRHLRVDGIFTHLATADEPDQTTARAQIDRFNEVLGAIGEPPPHVHVQNSAGVASLGALPGVNTIRPGVSLYGLHTAPHLRSALSLVPALEWRSRVRRVADVKKGQGVSYGHVYRMPRDGRIATVPVGYGDGLFRSLGERGRLVVGGRALPFAGRVCMDLVMLDVTDLPEVRERDEVVVIGAQGNARQTADDIAAALGTLNYEIVTAISRRVPRRYHRGGKVVAQRTLAGGYVRL